MDNQPNQQPDQPQPQYQPPVMPPQQQFSQPQVQSIQSGNNPGKVITIVGFVMAFIGLGVVGIILSIIGLIKSKKAGHKNGLAIAGIILNVLSMIGMIILISITLVSYNSLTSKAKASQSAQESSNYDSLAAIAKTSQAESIALTVKDCAEIYYESNGSYPNKLSDFSDMYSTCSDTAASTLTSSTGTTTAEYQYSGDSAAGNGGRIGHWDYTTGQISTSVLYVGNADEYSVFYSIQ